MQLSNFISDNGLMPHGYCLNWEPDLLGLHVLSDIVIALSYYFIPLCLIYFIRQRKDLPYRRLFWMFGLFIAACGTTHLLAAVIIWEPLYWLDGIVKALTAALSAITAATMPRVIPQALQLPTHAQLEAEIAIRKKAQLAQQEALERLHKIANLIPGAVFQFRLHSDGSSCVPYASEGLRNLYRLDPEQVREDASAIFAVVHPDDIESHLASIQTSARDLTLWRQEFRLRFDGEPECWLFGSAQPQIEADGSVLWHGFLIDITERKKMEDELKRSNAELDQFAYAVSHDMRQPLRMVTSYLSLLERALTGQQLDEDSRQYISYANDGAKRMDRMILAMLEFSRVGRNTDPITPISSREVLDDTLTILNPEIIASGATLEVTGDWPTVAASRDELTRLLQNLIGNALKYHEADRPPYIETHADATPALFRVSIRDHGIGIDPKHTERLFKVFSRLQARTHFEGTGVGLALCRKIVEHHNGKIGVESAGEGQGSTFWFELPQNRVCA